MGCAASRPAPPDWENIERKGVPVRVEVPVADSSGAAAVAFRGATVGRQLEGESRFILRVDNGGPLLGVMLKRPLELNIFSNFNEVDDGDDDDEKMEKFMKALPAKAGDPVDIVTDGKILKGRISTLRRYEGGERLLVLHAGKLVDASVDGEPLNLGSLHRLHLHHFPGAVPTVGAKGTPVITMDLNDFNHSVQRFESAAAYSAARTVYLAALVERLSYVEDAITGNRLRIEDQLVYIGIESHDGKGEVVRTAEGFMMAATDGLPRLLPLPPADDAAWLTLMQE